MNHRKPVHTKVLATLGPKVSSVEAIGGLMDAGADAFRLNFSHGAPSGMDVVLGAVREAAAARGVHAAVVGDLCGPKVRLAALDASQEGRAYHPGDELTLVRESEAGRGGHIGTNYDTLVDEVEVGHRVLVDDGAVRFIAVGKGDGRLVCRCTAGGTIHSRKGVNLPDTALSLPAITAADERWIDWSLKRGVDYLALSFVRSAADVRRLRAIIADAGSDTHIIAKIEHPRAVADLEPILDAADAVMIARGDLGVEMDVAEVPLIQKDIIRRCAAHQKPVIVATQMLQSMIDAPRPTRAEVSDVANAIYDGADTVMLSGETAVGAHPMLAVHTMNHIADVTEKHLYGEVGEAAAIPSRDPGDAPEMALAQGACRMARSLGAKAIAVLSRGGTMARLFAKLRPHVPVLALGGDDRVLRRMALFYGVMPVTLDAPETLEGFLPRLDELCSHRLSLAPGDPVLIVGGLAAGKPKRPNAVMIYPLGERGGAG